MKSIKDRLFEKYDGISFRFFPVNKGWCGEIFAWGDVMFRDTVVMPGMSECRQLLSELALKETQ